MDVSVISIENIKPWSVEHEFKPFKLCLLDQLMASTYSPLVLFYPMNSSSTDRHEKEVVARRLKASLSKTLNPFYPVSGRVKDNLIIHDFQQGVPFTKARVKGNRLFDFLASPPNLGFLHNLLPSEPFCLAPHRHHHHPLLAVQLNTFDCGGIALGLNMYHKLMDGATTSAFLRTWAANCNVGDPAGSSTTLLKNQPELRKPSSVFHPRDPVLVDQCQKAMESMIFPDVHPGGQKATTRRFVFDKNAITSLRARARSSNVTNPTRLEALSAFFWEAALKASTTTTPGERQQKLQCFMQSVNLRSLMSPRLSNNSVGNLVTTALASCKDIGNNVTMKELVGLLREGMAGIVDEKYINAISDAEHGFEAMLEGGKLLGECGSGEIMTCSSWIGFGTNNYDFGWGKPLWTGLYGDPTGDHPYANNFLVFKELGARVRENSNAAIEAWIRLDEDVMAVLEHDPHFIQYVSPNPPIILN